MAKDGRGGVEKQILESLYRRMNAIQIKWLVRIILDEGLPYPVVVLAHYWQR